MIGRARPNAERASYERLYAELLHEFQTMLDEIESYSEVHNINVSEEVTALASKAALALHRHGHGALRWHGKMYEEGYYDGTAYAGPARKMRQALDRLPTVLRSIEQRTSPEAKEKIQRSNQALKEARKTRQQEKQREAKRIVERKAQLRKERALARKKWGAAFDKLRSTYNIAKGSTRAEALAIFFDASRSDADRARALRRVIYRTKKIEAPALAASVIASGPRVDAGLLRNNLRDVIIKREWNWVASAIEKHGR
jgi:hypothetical protein